MLTRVLHEIKTTNGTIDLGILNRKLGIERSALDGMIQYLVQAGYLVGNSSAQDTKDDPACNKCSPSCPVPSGSDSSVLSKSNLVYKKRKVRGG